MLETQIVHCPNCGGHAERSLIRKTQIVQTSCSHCDYLMISYADTGKVVEAYAPGLTVV